MTFELQGVCQNNVKFPHIMTETLNKTYTKKQQKKKTKQGLHLSPNINLKY